LEEIGLSQGGFLLLALLSGGDYDDGVEGCGAMTALGLAKCGFGAQLVDALTNYHNQKLSAEAWDNFLVQWRAEMRHELTNNSSGMLSRRYAKLALQLPETFPSPAALQLYSAPLISESFPNSSSWYEICEPMIVGIAKFCSDKFHWSAEKAKKKFSASLWDGVFLRLLYFVSFLFFIQFVEYLLTREHCGKA
jgi:Holliday junction resolvase YEN1